MIKKIKKLLLFFCKKFISLWQKVLILFWITVKEINLFTAVRYEFFFRNSRNKKLNTSANLSVRTKHKRVVFFTSVYGPHIKFYKNVLLRSIFQDGNIPTLCKNGYLIEMSIYTLESDKLEVQRIIEDYLKISVNSEKKIIVNMHSFMYQDLLKKGREVLLKDALLETMRLCIQTHAIFIMALPDFFFGNHSISNIIKLNMDRDLCIAATHLRVLDSRFLDLINNQSQLEISNAKLVSLALKTPHHNSGALDYLIDKETNCSFTSGLSMQKISDNLFSATHRLPTVFMANFISSDVRYFSKKGINFNHWDHTWPSLLMKQRRYKVIGSSEIFFVAEMNEINTHQCINLDGSIANDDYNLHGSKDLHKDINRNFFTILHADNEEGANVC